MKKKNYISKAGHQKIQKELHELHSVERPHITHLVQVAAANGDRSENADYLYGKRRLREIDRRIRFLLSRLENVEIVETIGKDFVRVQFGATVVLEGEDGHKRKYTIVGIDEVDIQRNYISWESPIGKSLIGKEEGDEVIVHTPKGLIEYTIIEIYAEEII